MSRSNSASSEVIIKNLSLTQWGILIVALWSLVLAFLSLANLLLITSIVQSAAIEVNMVQTWLIFGLNIILLVAFSLSTYGLFRQQPWGRLLFLTAVTVWAGLNFFALFWVADTPGQNRTTSSLYIDASRYAATLIISLVYLNLPRVKRVFQPSSGYLDNKDQTDNDNIN